MISTPRSSTTGKKVVVIGISTDADTTLSQLGARIGVPESVRQRHGPDSREALRLGRHRKLDTRNVFIVGPDGRITARIMKFNVLSGEAYTELAKTVAATLKLARTDRISTSASAAPVTRPGAGDWSCTTPPLPRRRPVRRRRARSMRLSIERASPRLDLRVRQGGDADGRVRRSTSLLRSLHAIVGGVVVSRRRRALLRIPRSSPCAATIRFPGRHSFAAAAKIAEVSVGPPRQRRRDRADLGRRVEPDRRAAARDERGRSHRCSTSCCSGRGSTSPRRTPCASASRGGAPDVSRSRSHRRRRTASRSPTSPDDDLAVIGSGPCVPDSTTVADVIGHSPARESSHAHSTDASRLSRVCGARRRFPKHQPRRIRRSRTSPRA